MITAPPTFDPHQLNIALFLLLWSVLMYAWASRKAPRARVLKTGALITGTGALIYFFGAWVTASNPTDWRETLVYNLRALPLTAAVAYIAYVLAANLAKKSPRLERLCRAGPYILAGVWTFVFLFGLLFPVPALTKPPDMPAHFLVLKLRNLSEFFVLLVSAVVFVKETLRSRPLPSLSLRLQHAVLSLGSICFSLLVLLSFAAAASRSLSLPGKLDPTTIALHEPLQTTLLVLGGVAYLFGLFLYNSTDNQERLHAQTDLWIEYRADLELELFRAFGPRVGDLETDVIFRILTRSKPVPNDPTFSFGVDLDDRDTLNASYTVKLLGLLAADEIETRRLISLLRNLHARLSKDTSALSELTVRPAGDPAYDLARDTLYAAMTPALELAATNRPLNLLDKPTWVQVAATVAAGARYLPPEKATAILDHKTHAVSSYVLASYQNASDPEIVDYVLKRYFLARDNIPTIN